MANKTFNTRIKNKRDTAANWEKVATTFQPLDGELIVVDTAAGKTRFKVGRYDSSKDRLLYYNEIPFTDEYLYNDLNESQGKIYDALSGLDERTIIESTLEPVAGADDKLYIYHIGLWQFPKTGFYKIKLAKVGALGVLFKLYARITKDDGTTPDDWDIDNLKSMGIAGGDGLIEEIYAQVDYINDNKFTVYRVQFFNCFSYLGSFWVNTYDKTTQKWAYDYRHRVTADHVTNYLTLTKGDVTTKFNGSTAQTVSIPTKTSELTNDSFVSYAEQTLTEDQQNQAKTNLGIDVLTGNTTTVTPTQVKEAILAGRPVAITHVDNTYGNLLFTSFGYSLESNVVVANLVSTYNTQYILADLVGMSNNDQWSLNTAELGTSTDIDNLKLNMINNYVKYSEAQTLTDEQKTQARENIGAICESDVVIFPVRISYIQGSGMANKTAKEIYDAHKSGKIVIVTTPNNSQYSLSIASMNNNKYQICFSAVKYDSDKTQTSLEFYYLKDASESAPGRYTFYTYNFDSQYVKFTAEQTLTDDQKAKARENINAPSPADAVYTVTASSTDGVAYTATVPGITSLTAGASFIMIPDKTSSSQEPTLNVNGLGAKKIRRRLNNLVTVTSKGYSNTWISVDKPFSLIYDGTYWIVEGMEQPVGADMYGTVPMATADANGNNIADTYATIAMLQSMLPKVTTINLVAGWGGNSSPYYQDVTLGCCTETSVVDLQPTPTQLASWQDEGLAFTTQSGNGTVRVYVAGGKPSSAISIQVKVQEVVEV